MLGRYLKEFVVEEVRLSRSSWGRAPVLLAIEAGTRRVKAVHALSSRGIMRTGGQADA